METTHEMTAANTEAPALMSLKGNDSLLCAWYHITIRIILGGLLVIFGLFGNLLTILVIRRKRIKSRSMQMLLYLMVADSCLLCIYGTMTFIRPVIDLFGLSVASHNLKLIGIAYLSPVGNTVNQVIVFFTVSITWQRYVSVHTPHKAKAYTSAGVCRAVAFISILFSILFNLPSIFQFRLHLTFNGRLRISEANFAHSGMYTILYNSVLFYIITYILPVAALIFMAISLTKKLRESKRQTGRTATTLNNAKEDLTILVIVVACIFIVCQSFSPLRRVLMIYYVPIEVAVQCGQPLFFFGPVYLISFLVNSASNFIVFVCCARGFKKNVRTLLCVHNEVQPITLVAFTKTQQFNSQR
ncbi:hypothetical protein CAPTEDRAFT_202562 [Capitella teleta]|uniref:G-protein coupled receptors family 1 profile domain-containing protein n=1 Tax=Capitella teleta TaxID=283909 RepID=R7V2P9_CAPTE|nr:hypothetical protein CAPTEDRAFT_202562 [Capitella teleta]|eukprot:ELU13123.1 hypothetical protein CAPTEDRAFT_202562 [Capitella teleta]